MGDGYSEISTQADMHIITSIISELKVFDMQKVIDLEMLCGEFRPQFSKKYYQSTFPD